MKNKFLYAFLGASIFSNINYAQAGGFYLRLTDAKTAGISNAGEGVNVENPMGMFYNPALAVKSDSTFVSDVTFGYLIGDTTANYTSPIGGTLGNQDDIIVDTFVPGLAFSHKTSDDLAFGITVNAPFGIPLKYEDGAASRGYATTAEILTIAVTPNISYNISDQLSVGAGLQFQKMDVNLEAEFPASISRVGDDGEVGYNLGMHFQVTPNIALGASYRSKISHDISGTTNSTLFGGTVPLTTNITTPEIYSVDGSWQVGDVTFLGTVGRENWSSTKSTNINDGGNVTTLTRNWKDIWHIGIGAEYQWNDELTFRAGYSYDESPIAAEYRYPDLPLDEWHKYSFGAGYKFSPEHEINFAYQYADLGENKTNVSHLIPISGSHEIAWHYFSVGYSYKF